MKLPTTLPAWQQLQTLAASPTPHLRELLTDTHREHRMSASAAGITLDASRQRVSPAVEAALLDLAGEAWLRRLAALATLAGELNKAIGQLKL